jgi:putative hydrolase of the HAD superfamily
MNLVFDLGGVVLTWNPEPLIHQMFPDADTRQQVKEEIFHHPDWAALDRGTLVRETAIQRAVSRTGLKTEDIAALMHRLPHLLVPIPQTIALIRRIKRTTDHKLFVLSNMHMASIRHVEQTSPRLGDLFDGMVISCYIQQVKPELEIYHYLLKQYGLHPADTVFIDDTQANLDAASTVGIQTIRFENPGQCERALQGMGCVAQGA